MAQNYVEIKVRASDTAKPDLTDLKARLDELGSKVENAKVNVDDADGKAKLLDLNAKLAALNAKVANPKISVAGAARAEAQIAALDAQMRKAGGDSVSLRQRLMSLGGAAGSIAGVGDAMSLASGDASMFQKVMAGAGLATGLLEPLLSGATVAVGGLASGLAAAGAGLGAFGLVAKGVYSQVSTAVKSFETAQNTTGKAAATAMKQYQAEMAALPPSQQAVAKSIIGMQNAWQNFVQSNTAGVGKVMSQGIGLLPKIFAAMQPLMAPVEKALSGLIGQLSHGLDSSGFKSFMAVLAQNTGPAITKLGDAIGHIVVGIGGILRAFMPVSQGVLSGLDKITAAFARWGSTLSSHTGFQSLMEQAKTEAPLAVQVLKNLAAVIVHLGGAMAGLSTGSNSKMLLQILGPVSGLLASLSKNQGLDRTVLYLLAAADAGKKIKGAFQGFSSAVDVLGKFGKAAEGASRSEKLAAAATRVWEAAQAALDVVMDANPISLIIIAIAAVVAAIVMLTLKSAAFRAFWKAVWHDVASAFDVARHAIATGFDFIVHAAETAFTWVKSHWPLLLAIITGPIGMAAAFVISHWHQITSGAASMIGCVTGFFRSLPGRIMGAISGLAGDLFSAGAHAVEMLASGIISAAGSVAHAIGSVVSEITSHLPFSPAKKGPLSGRGSPDQAGRRIASMLGGGMLAGISSVEAAAARVAGAAGIGGGGRGAAGAAGGGVARIQLEFVGGSDPLIRGLRQAIRVKGGNVQLVLGAGSG